MYIPAKRLLLTLCYSLARVTRCPKERGWVPCPCTGQTRHAAVLVSGYFCRQETEQLETVNSLSIITLHITQA